MRYVSGFLFALLLTGVAVGAQESKSTTETKVKSDNGTVVTMVGCVMIGGGTSFTLTNITTQPDKRNKTTAPVGGSYALVTREGGLDLAPYTQQKVELTGVVVPAATKGDNDDKISVKDTKSSATRTIKVARGAGDQFIVASAKTLAPTCE